MLSYGKTGCETMTTNEKISRIRELMVKNNIKGLIIPSGDPHMSEYFSSHWKTREFISGFTGSVGTLVITLEESGLWVDGRYYTQGTKEIENSEIKLFKGSEPDCPKVSEYLADILNEGDVVGCNGKLFSLETMENIKNDFKEKNIKINGDIDFPNEIWKTRPQLNYEEIFYLEEKYSGKTPFEKIEILRDRIDNFGGEGIILGRLDNISWIFNIRAKDILNNPVVTSYGIILKNKSLLFTDKKRLPREVEEILNKNQIEVFEYEEIFNYILKLKNLKLILDKKEINYYLYEKMIENKNIELILKENPIPLMKGCKNKVEIENIEKAYLKDACAQVEFYAWLESKLNKNEKVTEYDCVEKLKYYRSLQENYIEESFNPIVAYGKNAAMMHYSPKKNNSSLLNKKALLLNDSGGQYLEGTTDTTRTYSLGEVTLEEKHDFTLVLKSVINLSTAIFKDGCTGSDLDILARQYLWAEGLDYRCGTGHGIGFLLNVHETPPNFRDRDVKFQEGMCVTIEPGIYKENYHGIRLENTVVVTVDKITEYGKFFKFKDITLLPMDVDVLELEIMNEKEIKWLNDYHKKVYRTLKDLVSESGREWLKIKTKKILTKY